MKTMNYLFALVLAFTLGSCSKETHLEKEELAALDFKGRMSQEQEKPQEVFELDLYQFSVLGQLVHLDKEKLRLKTEIEEGNKDLIPVLESVQRQYNIHFEKLAEIRDLTCLVLEIKLKYLVERAQNGDEDAQEELRNLHERFESCGLNIQDYFSNAIATYIFARVGGNVGGNCEPGIDFDRCIPKMAPGTLLVNVIDAQGGAEEVFFKSLNGRIISKGKMIGAHGVLEGVQQMAIELKSLDKGILEFKGRSGSFEQAVMVQ